MATINIRFRISTASKKEGIIFFQIIHRGLVRRITSSHKIFTNEWRNGAVIVPRTGARIEALAEIRRQVEADRMRLIRIVARYDSVPCEYSVDDIVSEYRRYMKEYTIFTYMNDRISRLQECGRSGTAEHYAAALRSFMAFRNGEDVMIDSIDANMIESYEAWMRMRDLKPNTVSFYLRTLRSVYRRAADDINLTGTNPFKRVFTGREETLKRAVPIDRLRKLRRLKLPEGSPLAYARDMFLLSLYLRGMSFVDMAFLTTENLDGGYVRYRRRKTNRLMQIKWRPEMQVIIDRNCKPVEPYLLPIFIEPCDNQILYYRRIAAGINRSLKKIGSMLEIPHGLTMYAARHSWASVARQRGVSMSVISEGMGHTSETTTRIYLSTLDTTSLDHANYQVIRSILKSVRQ